MATNPTLLTQPIAANGAKNAIPNTTSTAGAMSQDQGFPAETALPLGAGGVAPSREDFNGAFNLLSGIAFMAQKGWQFEFDELQAYFAGCIVRDTLDGKLYEALNNVPASSTHPSADSVNWKIADLSAYLPLSGGTMTGKIATNQRISMTQTTNDDSIIIVGGASYLNGAHVALFGNNRSDVGADRKGSFALGAVDTSQNLIELIGESNKSLTWAGVEVKQLPFPSDTQINIHDNFTWTNPTTTPYDLWRASGYVAPSNGYFSVKAHVANGVQWGAIYISSSGGIYQSDTAFVANVTIASTIPVRKGQVLECDFTNTDSNTMLFIPCVGEVM